MQDSLHISPEQLEKVKPVLLNYQLAMDSSYGDDKKQAQVMKEEDRSLKSILDKEQFKKYYRREEQVRSLPKRPRSGPHQPY
jgi:hypothetical protein